MVRGGGHGVQGESVLVLVLERLLPGLIEQTRADNGFRHGKGITVGGRTAVLKVTPFLLAHSPRDADTGTSVCHSGREVVDVRGLVEARQAPSIVQAPLGVIGADVILMPLAQSLNGLLDEPGEHRQHGHGRPMRRALALHMTDLI